MYGNMVHLLPPKYSDPGTVGVFFQSLGTDSHLYRSRGDSLAPFHQRLTNSSTCNTQPHARLCHFSSMTLRSQLRRLADHAAAPRGTSRVLCLSTVSAYNSQTSQTSDHC